MPRKPTSAFDSKAFLELVGKGRSDATYTAGDVIFAQGDPANAVFYIHKGKVKIAVVSEQGKEAVVALLGPRTSRGRGLAGQSKRIATAMAISEATISRIDKSTIVRLIQDEPAFSEIFIAHLLGRAIRVEADLIDQLFNSSEKRLARLLLLLANFGKDSEPEPVIAKISQRPWPR